LADLYREIQMKNNWTSLKTDQIVWKDIPTQFQWPQTYFNGDGVRTTKKLFVSLNGVSGEMGAKEFFDRMMQEDQLLPHRIVEMHFQVKPWIKKVDEFDYEAGLRFTLTALDVELL
jgi:hypothetical protein